MTGDTRGLRQGKKKWHFQKTSLLRRILDAQEPAAITRRIDWAITAVACVVLLCLHIALYRHSGAFWRDEACTLYVAKAPSWETMWSWMGKDSAPALMFGSVRLWIAAGPGATDEGLRLLGTLVSLGVMASLFVSCWMFTARVPLVGTALVLFSGAVFYYGSSLRAYGLAILLIMPCCAAFWRVCLRPSRGNVLASLILAVLAGHTSYQNSYLLLAIGLAAASVCGVCRLWKRSILVLTICFIAALSMLVYLPTIRAYRDASHVQRFDLGMSVVGGELAGAISMGSPLLPYAWLVVASSSSVCLLVQIVGYFRRRSVAGATPCLPLYLAMVAIIATTVCLGFLTVGGLFAFPWHYAPLIALAGIVVEVAFQSQQKRLWVWGARAAIACLMVTLSLPVLWEHAHLRRSNFRLHRRRARREGWARRLCPAISLRHGPAMSCRMREVPTTRPWPSLMAESDSENINPAAVLMSPHRFQMLGGASSLAAFLPNRNSCCRSEGIRMATGWPTASAAV